MSFASSDVCRSATELHHTKRKALSLRHFKLLFALHSLTCSRALTLKRSSDRRVDIIEDLPENAAMWSAVQPFYRPRGHRELRVTKIPSLRIPTYHVCRHIGNFEQSSDDSSISTLHSN